MSLEFQTVDVRFTKGLDTKTQPKLVIPGEWSQLQNCSLCEDNTPQRRDGIVALVAAATGNGLATHGAELLVVNGQTVSSVTTAQLDAVVAKSGELGYVSMDKSEVARSTSLVDSLDSATGNGFTCHVWRSATNTTTGDGVRYTLVDETTGVKVFDGVQLSATTGTMSPRVAYSSDAFFIFWLDAVPAMQCVVIRVATGTAPSQGARVALISSASLGLKNFDAISCDLYALGSPLIMVAYTWNDGVTCVRNVGVTHVAGVPSVSLGPTNVVAEGVGAGQTTYAGITALTCALFSSTVGATYVLSSVNISVIGRTISPAWANISAATGLGIATTYAGLSHIVAILNAAGTMNLFYDQRARQGTAGFLPVTTLTVDSVMTAGAETTLFSSASFDVNGARASGVNGPWIGGKPFRVGTSVYLPTYVQSNHTGLGANTATLNAQCTFFLMDASTGVVVGKAVYGGLSPDGLLTLAGFPATSTSTPGTTTTLSSGVFSLDIPEVTRIVFDTTSGKRIEEGQAIEFYNEVINASPAGVSRLKMTPNFSVPPIRVELGESTYFAGGQLSSYDGSNVVEHGFPMFPEGISAVSAGGGGAVTGPGIHDVVAIYEWVDAGGNRHQSAPCLPVAVTTVATDIINVIVPTLLVSQKSGVTIVLFMTTNNGNQFYRVSTLALPNRNITSAATLSIAINITDTALIANELLYTQPLVAGSTLPNTSVGPMSAIGLHQNRIFFDRTDNPGHYGFSQQLSDGTGLETSPLLGGSIDLANGKIIGFASMDEKVIILCENKPFVVYGSGPNGSGGFSTYGEPQEVSSDVGCSEARSILKMPQGIIFKSNKGWQLLGRDLQVRYIGDGVASFDSNSVSSAVLMADRQECRFSSTSGTQLIYSYLSDSWSTTVYRANSGAAISNVAVADAVYWGTGGYYATVSTVHGLNQDTPGVFLDKPGSSPSAVSIPTTGRTAWLRMNIINGFQRVRKMFLTGTSPNAPTSTLVVSVDFDDAYGQAAPGSYQFTVVYGTMFPTFTVGNPVDFRHAMQHQKCKSVAFTFVDTPTTTNPAGVNFQALSLELGLKKGLNKLPAAQSA